ncbi:MAG: tyrosine-protein phosphatase [Clostridia bacterium]|nr:tyrosine-protein phosphatase [Clostridia bacterium]
MSSLLASTANTRTVLPGNDRLLRSDAPLSPTAADIAFLLSRGVTPLIDLRSDAEVAAKPCPLAQDGRFNYLHMPVTSGNAMPDSPADVPLSYLRMVDAQMARILEVIRNTEGVMYFCTAGKDRTGVVSALLQQEHGLSPETIAAEYALSGDNLRAMFTAFRARHPEINEDIYTPKKEYMLQFLSMIK